MFTGCAQRDPDILRHVEGHLLDSNPRFSPDEKFVTLLKMPVEKDKRCKVVHGYLADLGEDPEGGVQRGNRAGIDVWSMVTGKKWDLVPWASSLPGMGTPYS